MIDRLPPALRHRDYRLFWTGGLLSSMGSQFTTVAMAWQIYQLTDSPLSVGLLGLSRAVPQIALSLFGGLLADAVDRRRLLIAIQFAQCGVSSLLMILTLSGSISANALFAASVALAFGTALETPSRQATVPNLVPPADLNSAIALNTAQRSVATIVGPSLAGVLIALFGAAPCYLVDAVSWFAMLSAVALIRTPLQAAARGVVSLGALAEGLRFVRGQHIIFAFMILDFGATLFGSSNALLPVYARDILDAGPVGLGILYAASSIGALVAATFMSGATRLTRAGKWVPIGMIFYALCTIGFGLSRSLPLSVLLLAGTGAGNLFSSVLRGTSNQLLTPDGFRGRVAAVNSIFVMGGPQLGQFESGLVASAFSPQVSAVTGGLGALALVCAVGLIPEVRRFDLRSVSASGSTTVPVPTTRSN